MPSLAKVHATREDERNFERHNSEGKTFMELKSPSVGKVLRMSVEAGAQVARGDEVMVIESMKVRDPNQGKCRRPG